MSLPREFRARVEEYVRPLYTELDGVETFSRVGKLEGRLVELASGVEHDARMLELLVLFQGVLGRLGSLGTGGRWQLFLRGLGLEPAEIARLRGGLERFADEPRTIEEGLLHDAVLLERSGIGAVVGRLLAAGRRRLPLDRALAQLDPGPDPERFHTRRGRELASARHEAARDWLADLETRLAAEQASDPAGAGDTA